MKKDYLSPTIEEMERVETYEPLRLETLQLAERLGRCKKERAALSLIEETFEAELGATADNRMMVEIMPEGKKPPLKLFVNTTDKRKLYRELIRLCLEDAKKLSAEKQERIKCYFDAFQQQQTESKQPQQAAPEHQQERQGNHKPTRGRGRPKETLKDKMADDTDGGKLQRLHTLLQGKKGKDAVLFLLVAVIDGWMQRPTYTQVINEFGDIGSKTGFNRYFCKEKYTDEEITGARNSLQQ